MHIQVMNMVRFLIYASKILVLFLLLGCSCTPTPSPDIKVEGIQPVWSTKLLGKAGIYNYGLIGLPIFNGKILFHSTYFTNIDAEDNRIHALDMKTGEIGWTFPEKYKKENSMFFGGVPYLFNEYIVTKMPKSGITLPYDRLICINMNTGNEVWKKSFNESNSFNVNYDNIVGKNSEFYFFQQTYTNAVLYKGDVITGDISILLNIHATPPNNYCRTSSELILYKNTENNKDYIYFGGLESIIDDSDEYSLYLYKINITNKIVEDKIEIFKSSDYDFPINHNILVENKIFFTAGRMASCYNISSNTIEWTYKSTESYNYMTNNVVVNEGVVFLYGDNRYVGLDANTGEKLYQGDIQCGNANAFNGYVYVIARDAKLYILDIKTGKTLHRIICPEEYTSRTGFNTYCKPQVYDDKLYVFGNYHAYCYDAEPKEE
jgi:outer membrane protein assembly factor BamB